MTQDNNALAQPDWTQIAKAAGEHGVRYRTNSALLAFLAEIRTPAPVASEVAGLIEEVSAAAKLWNGFAIAEKCPTFSRGDVRHFLGLFVKAAAMLERLAGAGQEPVIKLAQCYLCGTLAPEVFAAQCNRPECAYRQPVQQADGDQDQVEAVAEVIDQWIGDISTSREMARAAIAAMQPKGE